MLVLSWHLIVWNWNIGIADIVYHSGEKKIIFSAKLVSIDACLSIYSDRLYRYEIWGTIKQTSPSKFLALLSLELAQHDFRWVCGAPVMLPKKLRHETEAKLWQFWISSIAFLNVWRHNVWLAAQTVLWGRWLVFTIRRQASLGRLKHIHLEVITVTEKSSMLRLRALLQQLVHTSGKFVCITKFLPSA